MFVSSGRKWGTGRSVRGQQRQSQEEIQQLCFFGSLGEMIVKSDLLKQISYFRPQDVPFTKLILFQVGPIRQESIWKFDAIREVTSKNNINQQLNEASDINAYPELCEPANKEKGDWGRGALVLQKQPKSISAIKP